MAAIIQRPLRGSRITSFYPVKSLPSLSSLDSAFQLQEYISLLIRLDVHDVDAIVSLPGKSAGKEKEVDTGNDEEQSGKAEEKEGEKGKSDVAVDEACWIYEQLRRLAQDLTHPLITTLQQECTRASCPEMKAGEWLYLCVAHGNDGAMEQCCAIDYILHTLDSATALLNSPRAFPSRLQIPQTSHRHFSSLARRLGRIFAHAYFHHREAFEQAEVESSLYARFLALTSRFDLVPSEFLVIPPSAVFSHLDDEHGGRGEDRGHERDAEPPRLLGAAVDSQAERDHEAERERSRAPQQPLYVPQESRPKSRSPPGLGNEDDSGTESPRRGRNRTDTMVLSDASMIVDELQKLGEEEGIKTARPGPETEEKYDADDNPEERPEEPHVAQENIQVELVETVESEEELPQEPVPEPAEPPIATESASPNTELEKAAPAEALSAENVEPAKDEEVPDATSTSLLEPAASSSTGAGRSVTPDVPQDAENDAESEPIPESTEETEPPAVEETPVTAGEETSAANAVDVEAVDELTIPLPTEPLAPAVDNISAFSGEKTEVESSTEGEAPTPTSTVDELSAAPESAPPADEITSEPTLAVVETSTLSETHAEEPVVADIPASSSPAPSTSLDLEHESFADTSRTPQTPNDEEEEIPAEKEVEEVDAVKEQVDVEDTGKE
ncbi:hypothetical protein BDQ12DRAFT_678445 [Crucibulum laeve]|uniref:Mob1/phocein n=1 Tax=Crucibulum laeve TaxID=68775 RepID=A0A5C3MKS2_9AGAR|nr:hypothetical protein BDQ12DRAFT_678445 [Crucibulum laeve]